MPFVQNPSIGAGGAPLLVASTVLTAAQILQLNGAGVSVVAAPGAGLLTAVLGMAFVYRFGTIPFTLHGSDAGLSAEFGAAGDEVTASAVTGVVQAAADAYGFTGGLTSPFFGPITDDVNQPIVLLGPAYNAGPILTATLGAGGLGYAANDTGTITNGANDATYKVLTVGAGGAVLTFQITGAGTACVVANGNATVDGGAQPGVGVGFTVNITAVQTGDGTLKVVTYYQIIPVP